jgi:hypothetical protein
MKIAIVSESPTDEAAIKILIDTIIGKESELASLRARSGGWSNILRDLSRIINILHYSQPDVEAIVIVMDSDDSRPHAQSHNQPDAEHLECRLCQARAIVRAALAETKTLQNRVGLKTAIGLAVPAIEAWFRCGVDTRVNEVAWSRKLQGENVRYDRQSLKLAIYGSYRSNIDSAVEAARRVAGDLELLELLFPNGFGSLLQDVRNWFV